MTIFVGYKVHVTKLTHPDWLFLDISDGLLQTNIIFVAHLDISHHLDISRHIISAYITACWITFECNHRLHLWAR